MSELKPPYKRHILGKSPTHLLSSKIHTAFKGCPREIFVEAMKRAGVIEGNKPSDRALNSGIVEICEKRYLWNIKRTLEILNKVTGLKFETQYVNQELPPKQEEPKFVGFAVIKTYFNVSPAQIGKWLSELSLRDSDGLPSKRALDLKIAEIAEMRTDPKNKKKIKKFGLWNLDETLRILVKAGHPLDFDYDKSLKATGKNSEVKVRTQNSAVEKFLEDFTKLYKNPKEKYRCEHLVSVYPRAILLKAEEVIRIPGFFTEKKFL